ncbi:hypothetical protein [uncultured Coprobacter sp.]|uniref:hypothetical protein n=1 Tax=uncultured Coprobacter sp. TaxID=1720550 RepID=UPI0025F25946|nr:hypothetical protein [uncultured Coprobacter sp.]
MVDIKSLSNNEIIYSTEYNEGCQWNKSLMGEDYITLKFSSDVLLSFHLGDYVETEFGWYELSDLQKPVLNTVTGGYDYALRFDAYYRKWRNKILFYNRQGMKEASWNLTDTADKHLSVVLSNLEALNYTYRNEAFTFYVDETVEDAAKSIQYDNTNILDALTKIAEAWECEWWITDNVIHLGRCEYGDPVKLEIGKEVAEMSANESRSNYATRIYAFGSTRNIPGSYRKECRVTITEIEEWDSGEWLVKWDMPYSSAYMADSLTVVYGDVRYEADLMGINDYFIWAEQLNFEVGDIVVLEGVDLNKAPSEYIFFSDNSRAIEKIAQQRLMLPAGKDHIDAFEGMSEEEAVEDIVVFEDIYPERIGTIANVFTHNYVDEIKNEDGSVTRKEWKAYRFKDDDPDFYFSERYIIDGQLRLKFCSGALNGMDFAVIFNPHAEGETFQPEKNEDGSWNPLAQVFEIKREEESGRGLPAGALIPQKGDTYVLYGFDISMISDIYIPDAEERLLEKAREYVEKSKIDPSVYTCKLISAVAAGYDPVTGMSDISKILDFDLGDSVNLVNPAYFPNGRLSRVIGFEKKLDRPYDAPVYTIGEKTAYSRIGAIEDKIDEIVKKEQVSNSSPGNAVYVVGKYDNTVLSDRNVLSSLRSRQEFVSRLYDDIVDGTVTFKKEQVFKKGIRDEAFVASGTGWHIGYDAQNNSYMEIDKLNVRKTALFHEIVNERISHVAGAQILSLAAITVSSVEEIRSGTVITAYKCFFDTGDGKVKNNFVAGDKAMCQVFSGTGTKYYWMLVLNVGSDYITLSNTVKDTVFTGIPEIGDYIVQCGNRSDPDRQSVIMLRSFGTPEIIQYKGVGKGNEFTFTGKDVSVISPAGNKFTGDFISKNTNRNIEDEIEDINSYVESEISQTNEHITLAVKGIEIGGRNYVLNSENTTVKTTTTISKPYSVSPDFINEIRGKEVTISAFMGLTNGVPGTGYYNYAIDMRIDYADGEQQWIGLSRNSLSLNPNNLEYKRHYRTSQIKDKEISAVSITDMLITGYESIGDFTIEKIKIEIGNKPTDWSPAPEDKAGTEQLKEAGIDIKAGTITLSASDKTKVEAILPNGSKVDIAVFEIRNNKPVLRADIISGDVIANVIKTNTLNINNNTIIDRDGILTSKNGMFENINAKSGKIGNLRISDTGLSSDGIGIERGYIFASSENGITRLSSDGVNAIVADNTIGTTLMHFWHYPDNEQYSIDRGIFLDLEEYKGFSGIYCKCNKKGGSGTVKGIVIETANPKDDIALEAIGRVRFYNVRDISNENAIYNLQLYAQSAGNGNFYLMAKSV